MFALEQASLRFGTLEALRSVDLQIAPGERIALIGPSGSGKTTLLRLLGAQLPPGRGTARILGNDPLTLGEKRLRQLRARIGFLPQDLGLVPNLRVIQNVLAGRCGRTSLAGTLRDLLFPRAHDRQAALALLERVGIPDKLYERTDHLSGGQRQRVALARALFQDPEALLADEPVSAVDPARARDLLGLLVGVCEDAGLTLVVSMHQLEMARAYFPRLVGLKEGRVLFDSSPDRISADDLAHLFRLPEPGPEPESIPPP